jgi:hypothetical protein
MLAKDEVTSGPKTLLRSDRLSQCECSLALPRPIDEQIPHRIPVHKEMITADYVLDGVRFVEMDGDGRSSDRAKAIKRRRLLNPAG